MRKILTDLRRQVANNRRDMIRVALQTALAAVATYWVMTTFGKQQHLSWAVISALFTITVSADAAITAAAGRIFGALLGVGTGLLAGWLVPGPVVVGLAVATAAANTVATVWSGLSYMAVTAAIVALDQSPDMTEALERAAAVLMGTLIGALATVIAWPSFGRQRAAYALQRVLGDCEELLDAVIAEGDGRDRDRNAVYARFLSDLEALRSHVSQTLIAPQLPSGVPLRGVPVAVESLWHSLVILDRAVLDERETLGPELVARVVEPVEEVQKAAKVVVSELARGLASRNGCETSTDRLAEICDAARRRVVALRRETGPGEEDRVAKRLHALLFAFDEIERRLDQLSDILSGRESRRRVDARPTSPPPSRAA